MLEKIVLFLLGSLTTGVGVLIMRWLRKDHISEEIERRAETAKLRATMRDLGITEEQVDATLAWIVPGGRKNEALSIEAQLEAQEYAELEKAVTQADMNNAQGRRLKRLERRMRDALADLSEHLDDEERATLATSQSAWEAHADSMAKLAGARWESGSMQPFMVSGIRSRLTKHRAEDLETELANVSGDQPS